MPTYRVTAPDGKTYNVTPPDGANVTQEDILNAVKQRVANKPITEQQYNDAWMANVTGLGLGIGDELNAGISSLIRPDLGSYDKQLEGIRESQRKLDQYDRFGSILSNVAGGAPVAMMTGAPVAGVVAKALPTLGKVGQAAVVGGLYGGAAGFGSGEGGVANRLGSAAIGAGTGALLGAGFEKYVNPVISGVMQRMRGNQLLIDPNTGQPTAAGQKFILEYAQKNGIDLNELRAAMQADMLAQANAAKAGTAVDPKQAAALAEANTLPHRVPYTRGQLTENADQHLFESEAARGRYGPDAQKSISDIYSEADNALRSNVEAIRSTVAGPKSVPEPGQRGGLIQGELATMRDTAEGTVNSLYDAARQGGDAAIAPDKFREAAHNIAQDVFGDYHPDHIPLVAKTLNGLIAASEKAGSSETLISSVFRLRRNLVSLQGAGGAEGGAAGAAKKALDKHLLNTIDEAALSGDKEAIQRWKDAIAARRDFGTKFEGEDLVEKLISRDPYGKTLHYDPESAVNLIFGRSDSGFTSKLNMSKDLMKMKNLLGEDSAAWRALKEEAFMRFMRAAQGAQRPGERAFSGANLATAWESAMEKNPEVLRQIFSGEELKLISQFVRVARRATVAPPGGVNTSASAGALTQAARKLLGNTIVGPKVAAFLEQTPLLKNITYFPDAMRAAGSAATSAETSNIPVQASKLNRQLFTPALAGYAGQRVNER